jgi:hypothetical protein
MGSFHSFAQVLEKKIRKEIEQEFHANPSTSPAQEGFSSQKDTPAPSELWNFLVGNLDPIHFTAPTKGQVYHGQRKPTPPKPPHQLSALQQWAVDFFAVRGIELSPRFSSKDLQSAFRKLALRMHPDQGGSPIEFQNLMTARAELAQLF